MKWLEVFFTKVFEGIIFITEYCQPNFLKPKEASNFQAFDYQALSIERKMYKYSDFLVNCRDIGIHDDVTRAVWNLSRNLMTGYEYADYKPFLQDDLCQMFCVEYEDIEFSILDKAYIGLGCDSIEKTLGQSISSDYSIIGLLKILNAYYRDST